MTYTQETLDQVKELANVSFNETMAKVELVGRLTNWRENIKDNKRRTQILNGYSNIMAIVSKATDKYSK